MNNAKENSTDDKYQNLINNLQRNGVGVIKLLNLLIQLALN